jgi:hypothetical protein
MRTVALVIACSGCLISEPEGTTQQWPPELGGTVENVVAGDLDGNGSTDIVVMMSGTPSQAGLYYLNSDRDLLWETGDPVVSVSRFVPMELVHPVGAIIDARSVPRIYVATGSDKLTVSALANDLTVDESGDSTVPGGGSVWLGLMDFPGAQSHVVISNGSSIDHLVANTVSDRRELPALNSPTWNLAQVATSFPDGAVQRAVVATAGAIYRCAIPTTPGSPFAWEVVRTGAPWLGQTAYDFDGDGREEIIGFDAQAHDICVVDPGAEIIPVTPSCIHLTSTFTGSDIAIFAGTNLSPISTSDILVVQGSSTETNYSLAEDITYSAVTMMVSAAEVRTIPEAGPPRGRTVLARPSPGRGASVITFGSDGTAACVLGPC